MKSVFLKVASIFRNELNERMSNTQDGTFLVRNSSDGVKDNYTLAVRCGFTLILHEIHLCFFDDFLLLF